MQKDAGQKQDVVEQGGGRETARQQPANLENALTLPTLDAAEGDKEQPQRQDLRQKIQLAQLTGLSLARRFR